MNDFNENVMKKLISLYPLYDIFLGNLIAFLDELGKLNYIFYLKKKSENQIIGTGYILPNIFDNSSISIS